MNGDLARRHVPEPRDHGNLVAVGDDLFDATITGVNCSAIYAIDHRLQRPSTRLGRGFCRVSEPELMAPSLSDRESLDYTGLGSPRHDG